ncbi:MAG: hypothetical protein RQ867_08295 [Mariprofundaceae bacterium]|nr:hypothetical protein [Mariprofundaceae bacterium]
MKRIHIALLTVLLLASPMAASAEGAVSEMARIMISLNHYPTSAEQKVLAEIVADNHATAGEKTIAGALMRMQHSVGAEDAERLRRVAADDSATAAERDVAGILLGISHQPSKSDISRLKAVAE